MELKMGIKFILNQSWGSYTSFLDDELIDAIIDASIKKEPVEGLIEKAVGGSSFDWQYAVQTIYDAAEFIATVLSIYQGMKVVLKRNPTPKELQEEVIKQTEITEHQEEKEESIKIVAKSE